MKYEARMVHNRNAYKILIETLKRKDH